MQRCQLLLTKLRGNKMKEIAEKEISIHMLKALLIDLEDDEILQCLHETKASHNIQVKKSGKKSEK